MIPKVNNSIKYLIISILENEIFNKLNKSRKDFIISVLWHILSIKGRINFLQLGRYSSFCEQTYRNQFEKEFDFYSFNKILIDQIVSDELAIAFDPSYVPKAGKATYGRGRYWSGVAGAAKWGLDICGFAVVDIVNNTAMHLKAWQTPPAEELSEKGLNLLTHYASLVTKHAEKFKAFSNYMIADAYFSKRPFVEAVLSAKMNFISRLRDDSVLKYKFKGEPTGKKGAPKKFAGLVDVNNFNANEFSYKAVDDLTQIWNYTFNKWSENQADKYYLLLIENCKEIACNPDLGKSYSGVTESLLGFKAGRHIIFYRRMEEDEVEITRILHEQMDLKNKIKEK